MKFDSIREFDKDFKKLKKKYRSLNEDLLEFKKVVSKLPLGTQKHFTTLYESDTTKIVKARLFCRYLRGSSLRIIYAYHDLEDEIEFLELYFKGDKPIEDRNRIKEYLKAIK